MISFSNLMRARPLHDELLELDKAIALTRSDPQLDSSSVLFFRGHSTVQLRSFLALSDLSVTDATEALASAVRDSLVEKREELLVRLGALGAVPDATYAAIPGSDES